jgi:hypothetical protein
MKKSFSLPLLPVLALLAACSHTNNLAKFNTRGKSAIFRAHASPSAASSLTVVESPVKNSTVGDIAAAVGSMIIGEKGRKKLEHAIDGNAIAQSISLGTRRTVEDYLGITPVDSMSASPDIIIETEVTSYRLVSSSIGLAVNVSGTSRLIDRRTGKLIWENDENHTVPLSETYLAAATPRPVSAGVSIFNAVRLLDLSEEEIREVVGKAAIEAGREIGESLREDYSEIGE